MKNRKVLFLLLLINLSFINLGFCKQDTSSNFALKRLSNVVAVIKKLPEARTLIQNVEKEGAVSVYPSSHYLSEQFGAFWDPEYRRICVNSSSYRNDGMLIGSIIFELHNALVAKKLNHLSYLASKNKISRNHYILAVERLEYQNSLNASKMIEKGIKLGLFPVSARLKTYHTFEEHYWIQQMGGHSGWIGSAYDRLVRNG